MRIHRSTARWALVVCAALLSLAMLPLLAHAQDVPRAALKHRADLTRAAHAAYDAHEIVIGAANRDLVDGAQLRRRRDRDLGRES